MTKRLKFYEEMTIFHYPKDEDGGVLIVFGDGVKGLAECVTETTPEQNESVDRFFEIHARHPELIDVMIESLKKAKAEFFK